MTAGTEPTGPTAAAAAAVADLEASIEMLTARSGELSTKIKEPAMAIHLQGGTTRE